MINAEVPVGDDQVGHSTSQQGRCHQQTKHWPRFNVNSCSYKFFACLPLWWKAQETWKRPIFVSTKMLRKLWHMWCADINGSLIMSVQCFSWPSDILKSADLLLVSLATLMTIMGQMWGGGHIIRTTHGIWSLVSAARSRQVSFQVFRHFENLKMTLASSGKHQPGWKHVLHCVYQRQLIKETPYYIP